MGQGGDPLHRIPRARKKKNLRDTFELGEDSALPYGAQEHGGPSGHARGLHGSQWLDDQQGPGLRPRLLHRQGRRRRARRRAHATGSDRVHRGSRRRQRQGDAPRSREHDRGRHVQRRHGEQLGQRADGAVHRRSQSGARRVGPEGDNPGVRVQRPGGEGRRYGRPRLLHAHGPGVRPGEEVLRGAGQHAGAVGEVPGQGSRFVEGAGGRSLPDPHTPGAQELPELRGSVRRQELPGHQHHDRRLLAPLHVR